jgi:hypothetical protein
MPKDGDEPTQATPEGDERDDLDLPGEGGNEIPVPRKDDVVRALGTVAKRPPTTDD